ncbi:universal stress protein [Halorussus halophilus]|uniref:universal stress protein n=1 Tax=Halorussus halophilus TaxID=2650975 RepID=UPI0013010788|nr:universal stress protein [Halorussus halophilus]
MYDTIVVPTDGSEHAVRAAEHALKLADAFDATVHLLNVVDVQEAAGFFNAGGVDQEYVGRLEDAGRELIRETQNQFEGSDAVQTAVVKGGPARGILDYADDHDADLLVMGTHGRKGVNRFVAGSVTEKVLRLAEIPVMTTRAVEASEIADGYDRILVPTDGSDCAAEAIDHAIDIAQAFDATVYTLYVVDMGVLTAEPDIAPATETMDQLEKLGEDATSAVAERMRDAGVEVETAVRRGFPAQTLLEHADENDVDLIAMGTHGRSGFERFFLGSTTEKIVRRAEMPVLAVPHEQQ